MKQNNIKIIGITGGVGCGKSLVLSYLKNEYDAFIVETDKLAHELQQPDGICYNKIVSEFGGEILDNNGIIDRRRLGSVVFGNAAKLNRLNQIVHPEVILKLKEMIADEERRKCNLSKKYFVIESAILFESKLDELCDETWYIYADEQNRRNRLKTSREYSDSKIDSIIKSQMKEDLFRQKCTKTVDNNSDAESTFRQIREELYDERTI